jgi:hypothetical protein
VETANQIIYGRVRQTCHGEQSPALTRGRNAGRGRVDGLDRSLQYCVSHLQAKLMAEAVEADGGDITTLPDDWQPSDYVETAASKAAGRRSHAAWLEFEAIGNVVALFPAETTEGLMHKARVLRREAQGLPAAELMGRRLATSILHDALELFGGADLSEPVAAPPQLRIAAE